MCNLEAFSEGVDTYAYRMRAHGVVAERAYISSIDVINLSCIGLWINHFKCGMLDYFGASKNKHVLKSV